MAAAQGIRAGRAFVELFADDTKLVRGLRSAEKRLKAFGASVQSIGTKIFGLGAAAIAPLLATTNVFAELGDQMFPDGNAGFVRPSRSSIVRRR